MSPLDGLKRINRDKIYRPQNRINFLIHREPEQTNAPAPVDRIRPETLERPRLKKHLIIKIVLISLFILLISGTMYLSERLFSPSGSGLTGLNRFNPFIQLAGFLAGDDRRVAGEFTDRVNILALGIGGEGHDGPYLTDTIIVISIKPSTGEVGLLSIPRDMAVKYTDGQWHKINEIYSLGRAAGNQGAVAITKTVEDTLKIPIHYSALLTFDGFSKFIDEIGGITIDVPNAFADNTYPTDDYKVQTVSFKKGMQLMDGPTALIYARSRHGNNFEGSDFARSRRQQLILQAVKDKLFTFSTLLSPQKITATMNLLGKSVETDMSIWQGLKITQMVKNTDESKIYRLVLDDGPDSLLEPGVTAEGAWILQPKEGNFNTLARQMNDIFNTGKIISEGAKIEIQNGTPVGGLAYWSAVHLEKLGYKIIRFRNAATQDYQRTVIYDLTDGQKNDTLKWLKNETGAYLARPVPDYLLKEYAATTAAASTVKEKPDLIVILGADFAQTFKLPELKETAPTSTGQFTATSALNIASSTLKVIK
ncbi:MAG: LCP family protein [Candidatus Komeilibacteria bacterium]|nr:LCP family protein [Candidatus Komeilibacteria bacterium]